MATLYGIKNCDTVKKARNWLDRNSINYQFHDFRSDSLDLPLLARLVEQTGWDNLLNRRSTSWRLLADDDKINLTEDKAIQLMLATPTLIKRPVLDTGNKIIVGFKTELYQNELIST